MDIYSEEGTKVVYTGEGGYESDKEHADKYLEVGKVYTVEYTDVYSYHTDVYLQEIPNQCFNSVHFDAKEDNDEVKLMQEEGASIDNVTTDILQLALRTCGIEADLKTTDRIIDLVELIEIYGNDTNLLHIVKLQDEWRELEKFNLNYTPKSTKDNTKKDNTKEGELCIFWDDGGSKFATIRPLQFNLDNGRYIDSNGTYWKNCVRFESIEQYQRIIGYYEE